MAKGWTDLFKSGDEPTVDDGVMQQKHDFDMIFLACYNTAQGKRLFETLRERYVDVAIYTKGDTLEATSYRQGMADMVIAMERCVEDANHQAKDMAESS